MAVACGVDGPGWLDTIVDRLGLDQHLSLLMCGDFDVVESAKVSQEESRRSRHSCPKIKGEANMKSTSLQLS